MLVRDRRTYRALGAIGDKRLVKFGVSGGYFGVAECTSQGELADGVSMYAAADGEEVTIEFGPEVEVTSGTTFSLGDNVTVDTGNGKVELAASGDHVFGKAMKAATAADQVITVVRVYGTRVVA